MFICGIYVLLQPYYFWDTLGDKLKNEGAYKINFGTISLRLQ